MVVSTTLVDFFFKLTADHYWSGDRVGLTAFFGGFHLCVGSTSLAGQLLVTPWLLRHRRAFLGLLAMPAGLLMLLLGAPLASPLTLAFLLKLVDSVFAHGVYRSCLELLFTPLPRAVVSRWKLASDGLYGRAGLMLVGLGLWSSTPLLLTSSGRVLLPIVAVPLGGWMLAILRLRWHYERWAGAEPSPAEERNASCRTAA